MARFQAGALVVYGNLGGHEVEGVGLPTIVMQAIGSVVTFAVNGILLGVSSTAVAFFGIYYKLQNFLMMPVNGLGQAAIPVVGFNYGSGQSDRVKQAWKVLLPTGVVFALCGAAVFLLFPAQLLGLFSASDEMLAFGVPALRIISVTFLVSAAGGRVAAPSIRCALLAYRWPRPQQLLAASAAGGARRRCSRLRCCSNPPAYVSLTFAQKKTASVSLHQRFFHGRGWITQAALLKTA